MYEEDLVRRRAQEDYENVSKIKKGEREELDKFIKDIKDKIYLNQSYIDDKEKLKVKAKHIKQKRLGTVDKFLKKVRKTPYFTRLFPLVKEEKPGRDLYATTTFWQFVTCFFVI